MVCPLSGPSGSTHLTPSREQSSATAGWALTTTTSRRSSGRARSVRSSTGTPASGAVSFSPGAPPKRSPAPAAMTTQPRRATPSKPEKHVAYAETSACSLERSKAR